MSLKNTMISRFKNSRKKSFLEQPLFKAQKNYAFIGVGMHSIANLYPILHFFNIRLKYIYTPSFTNAKVMAEHFAGATATADLSTILNDNSIAGVFVCAAPLQHFDLVSRLLAVKKHVFIEKPPCFSSEELEKLIQQSNGLVCMPNLQKRFGAANHAIEGKIKKTTHYHAKYLLGAYPEGNPVYELFIHPIDNCIRLFGEAGIRVQKNIQTDKKTISLLLMLEHHSATGVIELSTAHNWQSPVDTLEINTPSEVLHINYPNLVEATPKGTTLLGIPFEKIRDQPVIRKTYYHNNSLPTLENSHFFSQGFYGAVRHFILSVEQGTIDEQFQVSSLRSVYRLLDQIAAGGEPII